MPGPAQNRPVEQHYVTAGYLRRFVPDGESALHVIRRKEKRWFRQKPENIATRANFYSVLRSTGEYDDTVENTLARFVEAPGLTAIRKLIPGCIPSWSERVRISLLLAVQHLRVPRSVEVANERLNEFGTFWTKEIFARPDHVLDLARHKNIPISTKEQVANIRSALVEGRLSITAHPGFAMGIAFAPTREICEVFVARDWTVYVSPDPVFYTSDFPVYPSPSTIPENGIVGLVNPAIRVCAPISNRCMLVMHDFGKWDENLAQAQKLFKADFVQQLAELPPIVQYRTATAGDISRFNRETCQMAVDFVCGSSQSDAISEFLNLKPYRLDASVRFKGDLLITSNRYVR